MVRMILLVAALASCKADHAKPEARADPVAKVVADAAAVLVDAQRGVPLSADDMIKMLVSTHPGLEKRGHLASDQWGQQACSLILLQPDDKAGGNKEVATELVKAEIDSFIQLGYNPRLENTFVAVTIGAETKSVTGAGGLQSFGEAVYDPRRDAVEWTATKK